LLRVGNTAFHQVVRLLTAEEGAADRQELGLLYAGELNPVGPKAQKKVPVPDGLGESDHSQTSFYFVLFDL